MNVFIEDYRVLRKENMNLQLFLPTVVIVNDELIKKKITRLNFNFYLNEKKNYSKKIDIKNHRYFLSSFFFQQNIKFTVGKKFELLKYEKQFKGGRFLKSGSWIIFKSILIENLPLFNRVEVEVMNSSQKVEVVKNLTFDFNKNYIDSPVKGNIWGITNGISFPGAHSARSQIFAIDLSCRFKDSFGENVYCVKDGEVISVNMESDDFLKVKKFYQNMNEEVTKERLLGNYVIIKHSASLYSLYAHLRKKSSNLKIGENIKKGVPVGQVGCSGHTFGPHLHFQLMNSEDFFIASSLPFAIDDEAYYGTLCEELSKFNAFIDGI